MDTTRDTYFDSLKFVLILLVIFGHCIESSIDTSLSLKAIYETIYTFHMPLFIFISGYFSKNTNPQKIIFSIFKLLEVFLIIGLIWYLYGVIRYGYSTMPSFFFLFIKPKWALWYLLSLCFWKIFSCILLSHLNHKLLFALSIIICLSIGFIPQIGLDYSLSRTFVFYPFFVLGNLINQDLIENIRKHNKVFAMLSIIGIFIFMMLNDDIFPLSVLYGSESYFIVGYNPVTLFLFRFIFIIAAIYISYCVIIICPNNKMLSKYGKHTLILYIFHPMLILLFEHMIFPEFHISLNIWIVLIEFIFVSFILCLITKINFIQYIINPISSTHGYITKYFSK